MYEILYYDQLDVKQLEKKFSKVIKQLSAADFSSAEVKKLKPSGYYRAKLDAANRLLFMPARYEGQQYLLILEVIKNHDYASSRFLRGVSTIDEQRIEKIEQDSLMLVSKPSQQRVHCLDKFIVFDDTQSSILQYPLPLIVIGSAGSGKTSVTLEKLKSLTGDILYVSLSSYLVQHTQRVYFSHQYENNKQNIDFLSLQEYIESILIPAGREITVADFNRWISKQHRSKALQDGQKLFEEIRGVITGADPQTAYLSRDNYLSLGVKQSIYLQEARAEVYSLFEKYLQLLKQGEYYDSNILAHAYYDKAKPHYDAVVVDEVQDFTNSQLALVLEGLAKPDQFLLCGDANQIVHPNFFSWSKLKSFFYQDEALQTRDITRILTKNYRNSPEVTELANRILKFKNYRFGSIDKESHYLVESTTKMHGVVNCVQTEAKHLQNINAKTSQSTHYAVLVLDQHDKLRAEKIFATPLIFTVQEAKGLEYENVILYNFVSTEEKYQIIAKGCDQSFLSEDFSYGRAKAKTDKSLETYKFYINALYVAITRSIKNVYLLEDDPKHRFLQLLDINEIKTVDIDVQKSTREEWQKEASKLSQQGKTEQADAIKDKILRSSEPPWQVMTGEIFAEFSVNTINADKVNKKDAIKLLNYAVLYHYLGWIARLQQRGIKAASNTQRSVVLMEEQYFADYAYRNSKALMNNINRYGVEFRNPFNFTPLMCAAYMGNSDHAALLLDLGADIDAIDNEGRDAHMIALTRALDDSKWLKNKFVHMYAMLRPEAISLRVDNRLIKIDSHKSEYFILLLMNGVRKKILAQREDATGNVAFKAKELSMQLRDFPDSIVPAYRKKQTYINSLLARNEESSNYPSNRKLFVRVKLGLYIINPELQLRVKQQWCPLVSLPVPTEA